MMYLNIQTHSIYSQLSLLIVSNLHFDIQISEDIQVACLKLYRYFLDTNNLNKRVLIDF